MYSLVNTLEDEKVKGIQDLEFKLKLPFLKCFLYIFFKIFYFLKINPKRNYGIDLSRIIASILVLLAHISDKKLSKRNPAFKKLLYLDLIYWQCNNIYGLLSGYTLVRRLNVRRLIYLLAEFLYYVYYWDYLPKKNKLLPIKIKEISYIKTLDNIQNFWYFNSYLPVFFVLPLIHPEKYNNYFWYYIIIFSVLFYFFSIIPLYLNKDIYCQKNDCFFIFVFAFLGRCLGYMQLHKKIYFIFWGALYIWICYLGYIAKYGNAKNKYALLVHYINDIRYSPFNILEAIFLLLFCASLHIFIPFKYIISLISSLTFGTYIAHFKDRKFVLFFKSKAKNIYEINIIIKMFIGAYIELIIIDFKR